MELATAVPSPYLVPTDGRFDLAAASTAPPEDAPGKKANQEALDAAVSRLAKLQDKLYADDRTSILLVFQAMDAAGKDGTIRAVLSGVNPQGCQVFAFKSPSHEELEHDFLWRVNRALPERGRIGVWNRSHYEEVITVRANPQFLVNQRLPSRPPSLAQLWTQRFESIVDAERHWARNGTVILKFFLNVSRDEQKERLLARIDEEKGNWKFQLGDLEVRRQWPQYMAAYQDALAATSRPWAPWYCVPADNKPFMRRTVAEIVVATLERLELRYPELSAEQKAQLGAARAQLEAD
ncbi:MAG: polyphosphate kinase 2 family protein [Kofleriaceae bacterium]